MSKPYGKEVNDNRGNGYDSLVSADLIEVVISSFLLVT
jgi:hypothetical protein